MKKMVGLLVVVGIIGMVGLGWWIDKNWGRPGGEMVEVERQNLERYDFDSLRDDYHQGKFGGGELEILREIEAVETRRASFAKASEGLNFQTRQIRFKSQGKWITGMMNYRPEKSSLSPVIIMVRGYAEKEGYYSGSGSWRVADELAKKGYVTISLDFLGYAQSESESTDMLEARFEKVVNVLDLLAAVKRLPWVDKTKIGFWAHSNGGQIVLSVLEVTGEDYPTVLWAPMTQAFPESVLSTIDEDSPVKGEIERFLGKYDARRYAFENYLEWVRAPVLIVQGTADEWVRVAWQEEPVEKMRKLGKEARLEVLPRADHNLTGAWEEGVKRTVKYVEDML